MELFPAVFAGYLFSLALYFAHFELQKESALVAAKRVLVLTVVAHVAAIGWLLAREGAGAVASRPEIVIALLTVLASVLMEWLGGARSLMIFSLPMTLLVCLLGILRTQRPSASGATPWLWFHAGLILTGVACLLLAVSCAFMYLLQSHQLKSKHLGNTFLRLPSLNTLDRLHFRALSGGVILFSLGILTGLFWAQDLRGLGEVFRDPKVLLSFATCFLYWLVLSFHLSSLRRGQKIAAGTVLVFVLLVMTLVTGHVAPATLGRGV